MKESVASLLSQQVQCVLATQGKVEIALHLMAYAYNEDFSEIYFASLASTQKVNNMRECPGVTCLWDNRTGDHVDHVDGLAMSGFGRAIELTGEDAQSVAQLLVERNVTLEKLLADPSVVIFALQIDRYQWVEGYTRSMTYRPVRDDEN